MRAPASGVNRSSESSVSVMGASWSTLEGKNSRSSSTHAMAPAISGTTTELAPLWRACVPAPPSSSVDTSIPVNSATIVGPLTNAYDSSVITTKSESPMSNAGPETAGPVTMLMVGTTPEQSANALAAVPQPCSAAIPSRMSAPDDSICVTRGRPFERAVWAAVAITCEAAAESAPL